MAKRIVVPLPSLESLHCAVGGILGLRMLLDVDVDVDVVIDVDVDAKTYASMAGPVGNIHAHGQLVAVQSKHTALSRVR